MKELMKECEGIIEAIGQQDIHTALPAFTRQLHVLGQKYHLTADEVLRYYLEHNTI